MKALLMLAVIFAGVWLWRSRQPRAPGSPPAVAKPQDMVRCLQCGVHIANSEAVQGQRGAYCCQEHLLDSEH
jgi:uncharacterized protein